MARSVTTTFVARESQVAAALEALQDAGQGVPRIMLLGADAGVGKTRFLSHLAELAERAGAAALTVHCVDLGEVGVPYLPFAEALAELVRQGEHLDAVLGSRPALARLLPSGVRRPEADGGAATVGDGGPSHRPAGESGEDGGRLQLLDGIAAALGAVATAHRPLLLVVEDVHWADSSTRDVLRFLAARLRTEHVLVVASYRTDDLHRRHPLRPLLAELWRSPRVLRLELPPFSEAELRVFAGEVCGSPVPQDVLAGVMLRSEGNAYFAQELLEAGPGDLPWTLADVLRARLERLEPPVQHLVRVASVAGRRVSEPLLRAAWRHVDPSAALDDLLREAVAAQVLEGEEGKIAFRHALLAEVVEADLLPGERLALHKAYLAAMAGDRALGTAAERAHHARHAHDTATAIQASIEAADDAARLLAPTEELEHLETVLRLADMAPDSLDLLAVTSRAATAAMNAGRTERAVALARAAVELAQDAATEARLRARLAQALMAADASDAYLEAARALSELPDDAPGRVRAWVLAVHARACLMSDRDDEATASATRAAELARAGGHADAEADALATLAVLRVDAVDDAVALLRAAVSRATEAGDLVTAQRCEHNLGSTLYYAGRLGEAAEAIAAGLEHARAAGLTMTDFGLSQRFFEVLVAYARGDLTTPATWPGRTWQPVPMRTVTLYAAVAREGVAALPAVEELEPECPKDGQVALIVGGTGADAWTWGGRPEEAVAYAERAIEHLARRWDDYFLGGIWLSALALAALADAAGRDRLAGADVSLTVRHGDALVERARTTAERGRPRGGRLGPEGVAWLARAVAEHSRLTGRNEPELWRAAAEAFGYGYRYEEARCRWRWAEALLAHGDREGALEQARAAAEAAEAMGAVPLRDAVRALARRGRLDLPGLRRPGAELLTAREAEVLALVAQGLSNRQIGERLFISGKTVSVHVSNLLAKLGAGSRTEAVALAHQRGALGRAVGQE